MPGLTDLHNSYSKSLNAFTRTTDKKTADKKKDDELRPKSNKNAFHQQNNLAAPAFPLTGNMMFLSLLFWLGLSFASYLSITYGLMLSRVTEEADLRGLCADTFREDKSENIRRVQDYTAGEATPYLLRLQSFKSHDYPMESKFLPPLVTAITSAQFYQIQGLIKHIMEDIRRSQPDLKLIVYDLGLYTTERELLKQYCGCEVRDLNFELYPKHVSSVSNYAWRPIIIQLALLEHGSVIYVEPTTRFKSASSLNYLRMRGSKNYFAWDPMVYTSLIAYTDKDMFQYFNESRCAFLDCSLLTPEAIVVYRTEATWLELMRPWLVCALNQNCIAPKYATYAGCIEVRHPRTTGCHRFDMSALSIILNRGSQYTLDSEHIISFRLTYTAVDKVVYFPEQPWTYYEMCLLVFIPVVILIAYKFIFKKRRFCKL